MAILVIIISNSNFITALCLPEKYKVKLPKNYQPNCQIILSQSYKYVLLAIQHSALVQFLLQLPSRPTPDHFQQLAPFRWSIIYRAVKQVVGCYEFYCLTFEVIHCPCSSVTCNRCPCRELCR